MLGALVLCYSVVSCANSCEETAIELLIVVALVVAVRKMFDTKRSSDFGKRDESGAGSAGSASSASGACGAGTGPPRWLLKLTGCDKIPNKPLDEWTEEELETNIERDKKWLDFWGEGNGFTRGCMEQEEARLKELRAEGRKKER